MRARAVAFKDDDYALRQTRDEIRRHFEAQRDVTDPETVAAKVRDADDVVDLLLNNVVQAKRNERGNFEAKVKPSHASSAGEGSCDAALRPITDT